jgi:PAS domain S-box-containing protein
MTVILMSWLLHPELYTPHGFCLAWRPELIWLHVISDGVIALAYFAIPISLAIFVRRRTDLEPQHKALAILFSLFITACGFTHLASIVVLWLPLYGVEGLIKAVTALVSVATAVILPFLIPQLLRIPSPWALEREVASHEVTLRELHAAQAKLSDQMAETREDLLQTTRRFEAALRDSPITVFEQDEALIYTWAYNPLMGLRTEDVIGRTEADFMDADSAARSIAVKHAALDGRTPTRQEMLISTGARAGWFDIRIEPIALRDGRRGLIATATDITALKANEAHLKVVTRELNHRSKNLLTIVVSIVRQTAKGFDVPPTFITRVGERLTALAKAHDALARENWKGADILAVIEGQLGPQLETFPGRISLEGPALSLPSEAAHYIGLAMHELGSNAVKHGALCGNQGKVEVSWRVDDGANGHTLVLVWREISDRPFDAPQRSGFGSTILTTLTPAALGGEAKLIFGATGLVWTLNALLRPDMDIFADTPVALSALGG